MQDYKLVLPGGRQLQFILAACVSPTWQRCVVTQLPERFQGDGSYSAFSDLTSEVT
jgi:hypothetical protein